MGVGLGLTNKLIPIPLLPTGEAASGYLLVQWKAEDTLYLRFEMMYKADPRDVRLQSFRITETLMIDDAVPIRENEFDDFVWRMIEGVWGICIDKESIYYRTMKDMYAERRL